MTSLTKFCLHWTAGSNKPCETDLQAYHYCIDKFGRIFAGVYEPKDNINCYDGNMPSIVVAEIQVASVCLFVEWQALT